MRLRSRISCFLLVASVSLTGNEARTVPGRREAPAPGPVARWRRRGRLPAGPPGRKCCRNSLQNLQLPGAGPVSVSFVQEGAFGDGTAKAELQLPAAVVREAERQQHGTDGRAPGQGAGQTVQDFLVDAVHAALRPAGMQPQARVQRLTENRRDLRDVPVVAGAGEPVAAATQLARPQAGEGADAAEPELPVRRQLAGQAGATPEGEAE